MNINLNILSCKIKIQQMFQESQLPISVIVLLLSDLLTNYKDMEAEYLDMLIQQQQEKELNKGVSEEIETEEEDEYE